jgi:hypothetical protein
LIDVHDGKPALAEHRDRDCAERQRLPFGPGRRIGEDVP